MDYWQDFWIGIPMHIPTQRRMVGFADEEESEDEDQQLHNRSRLDSNYFCEVLGQRLFAKLRVQYVHEMALMQLPPPAPLERFLCAGQGLPLFKTLQEYTLTDKDKVLLAHAVAHSFWRFYGSDLMLQRWTSNNIWFMFENSHTEEPHARSTSKDRLALRAYMSLTFDDKNCLFESLDNPIITHPFPHILALGIILLEIGLGRPFRRMGHLPLASGLNWEHGAANQLLGELERSDWVRPTQKEVFAKVIANCLDPGIFAIVPGPSPKATKRPMQKAKTIKTAYNNSGEAQIDERRRRLYKHTVEPLARLVKIAFKQDLRDVSYLSRRTDTVLVDKNLVNPVASFPIRSKTIVAREWLNNLKHISAHIKLLQRQIPGQVWEPVKIAILDTGYDNTLAFFKQVNRKSSVGKWKDFVAGDGIRDDYGHGSLMLRLVMESAPLARIYVARVAENTDEVSFNAQLVAEAIRWAGLEEMVDIVSMSFGFPDYDETIANAIEDVSNQRNVIFMASAGNNAKYQNEAFPARHRHVISIRATNFAGSFSETNPPVDDDCITPAFGTFGGDLPSNISDEISRRFGPDICQPGSSIATAVAAGIAASTIAYAEVLSCSLRVPAGENPVQCLKSTEGMRRMLKKMSPDQKGTTRFVNPIWLWSEEAGAWKAWAAICNSVSKLMRQHK
ncbi:hypothetical protein F53441_4807 [Fusarium austroafricanum]|uniref:Peptidase S8/S53 domain-containing protein n=1 Tax=Fusarium austroafricanum TaxID=2364996 RepID=A0A8H4NYF2_9HYPO|nr:hypothetical protein F53441_4807 [Fusarium austroafricanum]